MDFQIFYLRLLSLKNRMEQAEKSLLSRHGLTRNDTLVVSALGMAASTSIGLSERCCIDKSTVTKIIKKLERDGYVKKSAGKKRGGEISLTDKGRELNTATYETFRRLEEATNEFFAPEEINSVNRFMDKFLRISEDVLVSEIENRLNNKNKNEG